MAEHTPGPWKSADGGRSNYVASVQAISARGNAYNIAMIPRPRVGEAEANARLIAAAPEMLEALVGALQLIEVLSPIEGDETRRIRRVIAKAKGTPP